MPTANQRISEYVLDEKVGGGSFGEVWKAHHHVWTDQLVALKIPTDPQYVRNLQTEGAAIHGLSPTCRWLAGSLVTIGTRNSATWPISLMPRSTRPGTGGALRVT